MLPDAQRSVVAARRCLSLDSAVLVAATESGLNDTVCGR